MFCECGCGNLAPLSKITNRRFGYIKGKPVRFISGHQFKVYPPKHLNGGKSFTDSGYMLIKVQNHPRANANGYVREHILVVEKVLGRFLPKGVEVHHINGKRNDNRPENLIVCQDSAYHKLIHQRQRAFDACGHAKGNNLILITIR